MCWMKETEVVRRRGKEPFCIPVIRSQSRSESTPLDPDLVSAFHFVLFYPFLPLVGQDDSMKLELSFFFPQVSWTLIKPQKVRLWLNSFSWGQTLLRRTKCSRIFRMIPSPLPLKEEWGELYILSVRTWVLTALLEIKVTKMGKVCRIWLGPLNIFWRHVGWFPNQRLNLGFCNESVKTPNPNHWVTRELPSFPTFYLWVVHGQPPAIHRLQFRFSSPWTYFHWCFYLQVSAPVSTDLLYVPVNLSSFEGSSLPCDLISLTDLRRVVDFPVCSALTC